jgi:uncharacterized protein (TIGR03435 family)
VCAEVSKQQVPIVVQAWQRRLPELEVLMRKNLGSRCAQRFILAVISAATLIPLPAKHTLHAQEPVSDSVRDWEKAAGGKQQFDAASVREDKASGPSRSNVDLSGGGNAYWVISKNELPGPDGSLLSAKNQTLVRYIVFAYRLNGVQELALRFDYFRGVELHVPDWVRHDQFDIEARAPANATKNQMRLMMQSLLADRFKLVVHWETRQAPVFALVEDKPGQLGPQLEPHPASDDCANATVPDQASQTAGSGQQLGALPIPCGMIAHLPPSATSAHRFGGRDVPLAMLAESMPTQTGMATVPRPVIDRTGRSGEYNFWMEWTPEDTSEVNNGETGGTFREALKNQLGLKLQPQNGPVEVLVIDHVEQPSPN